MADLFDNVLRKARCIPTSPGHVSHLQCTCPQTPFTDAPCRIQGPPLNTSDASRYEIALQLIKYVHRTLPEGITHVRPISLISDQHGNLQAEPIYTRR